MDSLADLPLFGFRPPVAPPPLILPLRIQLKRTRGWRMPENTIRCCRPGPLGNPFVVGPTMTADQAYAMHYAWLDEPRAELLGYEGSRAAALNKARAIVLAMLPSLRGKNLGCWCHEPEPGQPDRCHAYTLLVRANG